MGKLDHLFAKNSNVSKLKILLNLSISRLAVLRNQRQARCHLACSDIIQILNLGHHDRALIRVEQVIKEQNMLDVFVMIEGYCNLLAERINLLQQEKECPEELREAVSGLLYASTRCGEFPELIEMRVIFTSRFGKEFAARAIELRNNCGVNPRIIQKLSTRQPMLENRLKVLKEIAAENNIILKFEEDYSIATEDNLKKEQIKPQSMPELSEISGVFTEKIVKMEELSDSIKLKRTYKDVADAAQAAFESAAYAAEAARIAVELSKSQNNDPDDQDTTKSEDETMGKGFGKRDLIQEFDSETEDEKEILSEIKRGTKFDKSDDENGNENEEGEAKLSETIVNKEDAEVLNLDTDMDKSLKRFPKKYEDGVKTDSGFENIAPNFKKESEIQTPPRSEEKKRVSVRTRFRAWRHKNT